MDPLNFAVFFNLLMICIINLLIRTMYVYEDALFS